MATSTCLNRDCPTPDTLTGLIHGDLPEPDQATLSDHVGGCVGCQDRMNTLATGGDPAISNVVRHIDKVDPPKDSAYWRALNDSEKALTRHYAEDMPGPSGELNLSFLSATDTPGLLGRINSFDIKKVIGRGGMGVVLQGFDSNLHRDVAIKVLDPQLANNDVARKRFVRESRAAAAVAHDNIVAVYQVNEDEKSGLPYMVMQLVIGESLEQRLRRVGRLSVIETVRLGMQAAAGLASAHATGLIHRDVKPGNILLEEGTDKAKLTDFGLARAAEDMKLTRTGFVAGTPLYMAPEQAQGDEIDARSDLFSLGSVLYEALAGKPPFEGRTPLAVLRRVADEAHVPLRQLNDGVPEWLEDIIDRLLAKNPKDRFQTATEVSEYLAYKLSCLSPGSPLETRAQACLLSSGPQLSARAKKRFCVRTAAMLAVVFGVGLVTGAVGVGLFMMPTDDRVSQYVPVPQIPLVPPTLPAATTPVAKVDEGPDSISMFASRTGGIVSVAVSPDNKTLATGIENGRINIWDMVTKRILFELHPDKDEKLNAHRGPVWAVDYSADGTVLISASDDGTIKTWDVKTGKMTKSLAVGTSFRAAAVSPTGDFVAMGDRAGFVQVFDLNQDKPILQYDQGSTVNAVAFTPDGSTLASASTDGRVVLWDIAGDRKRIGWQAHQSPIYGLSFSPDSERLVTAGWDQMAILWNVNDGTAVGKPFAHDEGIWAVSFSPCGRRFATAGQDGKTRVWDAETGKLTATFGRDKGSVHVARFVDFGERLVTGGRDGTVRVWDTGCGEAEVKSKK